MSLIPIKEASERLGVSVVTLHGKLNNKYGKYRHKLSPKKVMFDIKAYEKDENVKESLVAKVGLFIEYLRHIENINYRQIASMAGVVHQPVYDGVYGFEYAKKIAKFFAVHRPFHVKRFDEYYGWEHTALKTKKVLG